MKELSLVLQFDALKGIMMAILMFPMLGSHWYDKLELHWDIQIDLHMDLN